MKRRDEAHEPPARSLFWLERPVCLEWAEGNGEGSPPSRTPAGSPSGRVRFLARVLHLRPSKERRVRTR